MKEIAESDSPLAAEAAFSLHLNTNKKPQTPDDVILTLNEVKEKDLLFASAAATGGAPGSRS